MKEAYAHQADAKPLAHDSLLFELMAARGRSANPGRAPLPTPDGRYLIIDGRLWRASNPDLSPEEREVHTKELMRARRGVRAALHSEDREALRAARREVDQAKQRLGERGAVWWDDGAPDLNRRLVRNTPYADWHARIEQLEDLILGLLAERETSWCPSEVARRAEPNGWRALMPEVRTAAAHLAARGLAAITQRGRVLPSDVEPRGPIRIERPAHGSRSRRK